MNIRGMTHYRPGHQCGRLHKTASQASRCAGRRVRAEAGPAGFLSCAVVLVLSDGYLHWRTYPPIPVLYGRPGEDPGQVAFQPRAK